MQLQTGVRQPFGELRPGRVVVVIEVRARREELERLEAMGGDVNQVIAGESMFVPPWEVADDPLRDRHGRLLHAVAEEGAEGAGDIPRLLRRLAMTPPALLTAQLFVKS